MFVGFNGGGDLMSLAARDGYEIVGCSSPSGNKIFQEEYPHWRRILLEDKLKIFARVELAPSEIGLDRLVIAYR